MVQSTLATACDYLAAGLSVLPIRRDGSKAPALRAWNWLEAELPTPDHVTEWFDVASPPGIAIICGAVSGNLELIDFDRRADELFPAWRDLVEADSPGLVERLSVVRTPRPGYHVRYRCTEVPIPGNVKLAEDPSAPRNERTLIETRGEGGYALAPGSPPECHENNYTYDHVAGPPLTELSVITAEEREVLLRCARAFDRAVRQQGRSLTARAPSERLRPGDDYDLRGPDWAEILTPYGWEVVRQEGAVRFWRRPGKDRGWSATTGYCHGKRGEELLRVFSSNGDPFEADQSYGKFRALAALEYHGDTRAAARALAQQGFGEQGRRSAHRQENDDADAADGALGSFLLRLVDARKTPQKILASLDLVREEATLLTFSITSNTSSHREPAARILHEAERTGEDLARDDILGALGRMIVRARDLAEARQAEREGGLKIADVVREFVPDHLHLTHRRSNGTVWSERKGRELARAEFVTYAPSELIAACREALDAPPEEAKLVRAIREAMAVLWSDLDNRLPDITDPSVAISPAIAEAICAALVGAWLRPGVCHQARRLEHLNHVVHQRFSLAALAREQLAMLRSVGVPANPAWHRLDPSLQAWTRPYCDAATGEERLALAMHYALLSQLSCPLPACSTPAEFDAVGVRVGALLGEEDLLRLTTAETRFSGRFEQRRLAVLSPRLADSVLLAPEGVCPEGITAEADPTAPDAGVCK